MHMFTCECMLSVYVCLYVCECVWVTAFVLVLYKFFDFHHLCVLLSVCVSAHQWCACLHGCVCICMCLYMRQTLHAHISVSACLFIWPVLWMVQRRIQCCWLFLCQSLRMQPPPLLTLPLILDHRCKSSSHPTDAFRFWWVFLFNSQGEERVAEQLVLLMAAKICCCFLSSVPLWTVSPSTHVQFAATGLKRKKEGRRKEKKMTFGWQWRKSWGRFRRGKKQVYLSHLHAGLSAPQTFNLSSCDPHARTWQTSNELHGIPSGSACSY